MSKKDLSIFGDKQPEQEPKTVSSAQMIRKSGSSLFTLPTSGLVVKLKALDKETLRMCIPWLTGEDAEGKKISLDEATLELQEIIVPRHMMEPKVVMSQKEEDGDPTAIYLENIPLIDRFAIATFIIRQDEQLYNQETSQRRKDKLDSFQ